MVSTTITRLGLTVVAKLNLKAMCVYREREFQEEEEEEEAMKVVTCYNPKEGREEQYQEQEEQKAVWQHKNIDSGRKRELYMKEREGGGGGGGGYTHTL